MNVGEQTKLVRQTKEHIGKTKNRGDLAKDRVKMCMVGLCAAMMVGAKMKLDR